MREGHQAERKLLVGALAETFREAIGVAAEKNQFADAAVAELREPFGQGVRIEIFPGGIEKDDGGGAVGFQFLGGDITVADFGDFDGTGAADAFDVVIEDGTHLGAAGFAEHQKPNFHNGLVSPEERSLVASLLGMSILVGWSLQPIFLAFFEEGLAADAKGFSRAADLVMHRFERGGDDLTLHFLQRA